MDKQLRKQRLTKRILLGSLAGLMLAIGITALVMGLVPVHYHIGLTASDGQGAIIKDIGIQRQDVEHMLRFDDREQGLITRANTKDEILRQLQRGGTTNALSQMFRSTRQPNRIDAPNTNVANIRNASSNQLLRITFLRPQFAIVDRELVAATPGNAATHVQQIFIPLNNVGNGWGEHQWFLSLNREDDTSTVVRYRMHTHGNFARLADFIYGEDAVQII
jgi:hypothetical protein